LVDPVADCFADCHCTDKEGCCGHSRTGSRGSRNGNRG
jgi:hypothetical protein